MTLMHDETIRRDNSTALIAGINAIAETISSVENQLRITNIYLQRIHTSVTELEHTQHETSRALENSFNIVSH